MVDVTLGVAQRSILGPDLCHASYDDLLMLRVPEETQIKGYADEVVALVTSRLVDQVQLQQGTVMRQVCEWRASLEVIIALESAEMVILKNIWIW